MKATKNVGVRAFLFLTSVMTISPAQADLIGDLLGSVSIIGGKPVAVSDPIASTTVALLAGGALCTASLIDDDLAITAAHCVSDAPISQMKLVFGLSARAPKQAKVLGAVVPSKWRSVKEDEADQGDIALVRFSGGIPAGFKKAKLLSDLSVLQEGGTVTLAGYGITQSNPLPQTGAGTLRKTQVSIADVNHGLTEIVFDQRDGRGACHGDSGGPAFVEKNGEFLLFGVTNRGFEDDKDTCGQFAVYTKIAAYKSFVNNAAKLLRKKK